MKTKMMIIAVTFGLTAMSCGEPAEVKENNATQIEETQELGNKLNELNLEIEAIDAADAEIDATINELDQI
jgi:chaperonin cofactor prefoldin